jgi:hypothetical protein
VRSGASLYILTNDGALLAVDLSRRQIEWVFKYDPPPTAGSGQMWARMRGTMLGASPPSPLIARREMLYFKEANSPVLYALEADGPRLKWKWQDSTAASLVGVDDAYVYLFSNEISAIGRDKPQLGWARQLPVELQGVGVEIGSEAIVAFTPRGLFEIAKDSGEDRQIFRGGDVGATGGTVMRAGNRLVSISTRSITAYEEPNGP